MYVLFDYFPLHSDWRLKNVAGGLVVSTLVHLFRVRGSIPSSVLVVCSCCAFGLSFGH